MKTFEITSPKGNHYTINSESWEEDIEELEEFGEYSKDFWIKNKLGKMYKDEEDKTKREGLPEDVFDEVMDTYRGFLFCDIITIFCNFDKGLKFLPDTTRQKNSPWFNNPLSTL